MLSTDENSSFSDESEDSIDSGILVQVFADLFAQSTQLSQSHKDKNNNENQLHQLKCEVTEPKDLLSTLLVDTTVYQTISDDSGYFDDNLCDTVDIPLICKSEYFVQESPSPTPDDEVLDCYPMIESSAEVKIENFEDSVDCMESFSSLESTEFNMQDVFSPQTCEGQVPYGIPEEPDFIIYNSPTCKISVLRVEPIAQMLEPLSLGVMPILEVEKRQSRKRGKCKCPNCSVEGGNVTRDSDRKLLHACHFLDCERVFNHTGHLKEHLIAHKKKKNFLCAYRIKKFTRKNESSRKVQKHVTVIEQRKSKRLICSKASDSKGKLKHFCPIAESECISNPTESSKTPLVLHITKKDVVCPHCNKQFEYRTLTQSKLGTNVKPPYICQIPKCGRTFSQKENLMKHLNRHSGQNNFFCAHCFEGFVNACDLMEHVKAHLTNKIQHACHIPDSEQISNQTLHLKNHSDLRSSKTKRVSAARKKKIARKDKSKEQAKKHKTVTKQRNCQCPNCSAKGGNKIRNSAGSPLHVCHFANCKRVFNRPSKLKVYLKSHHGGKNYACIECNKTFMLRSSLTRHAKIHVADRIQFICRYSKCGRVYSHKKNLNRHLKSHSGEKSQVKVRAKPKQKPNDKNAQKTSQPKHSTKKSVKYDDLSIPRAQKRQKRRPVKCECPNCSAKDGNQTSSSDGRLLHICHIADCERVFNHSGNMKRHFDSHRGKSFVCTQCNKKFLDRKGLARHVKIHKNEKSQYVYNVADCGRIFTRNIYFKKHFNRHNTAENQFTQIPQKRKKTGCQCPNCKVYDVNKIRDSNEKPLHLCHIPQCEKVFNKVCNLEMHLKVHTGKKNFFCQYCDKGYTRKYDCNQHVKKNTQKPVEDDSTLPSIYIIYCKMNNKKVFIE